MNGISELTKEEVIFEVENVKYYGVEVYENKTKKGRFSSFKKQNYIKTTEKIYVDYKLSDIRRWFKKVRLISKKEHLKHKGERIVKSISKSYEVVKENVVFLPKQVFKILADCNNRRCLFSYKNKTYYFVMPSIYRDTETDDYLFVDMENEVLEKTGYNAYDNKPSKEHILNWVQNKELS